MSLPLELQRAIFETAAKDDGRNAYALIFVSKYVHAWIEPILYERIVIRDEQAASCLLHRAHVEHPFPLFSLTKSLTVDQHIPQRLLKPLFAVLSRSIICFTIFRDQRDPDHLLRYIRSPLLRRLTVVYGHVPRPRLPIPHDLASSLSHLIFISNTTHGGFSLHRSIQIATAIQSNDSAWLHSIIDPPPSLSPFHRLTFLAVSYTRWPESALILILAPKLQSFAVLLPTMSSIRVIHRYVSLIRQTRDPRVVVLTHHGDPVDWTSDQGFAPFVFWSTVEKLSRKRCICDQGERWSQEIIHDFRMRHPEISLVGD